MNRHIELAREIQDNINDPNIDINVILRKCRILAKQLGDNEFEQWVEHELKGYENKEDLPNYRILKTESYGDFIGIAYQIKNRQIPSSCIPEEYREFVTTSYLMQPISHYASLLSEDSDKIAEVWPGDLVAQIGSDMLEGYTLTRAWKPLSKNTISTILEQIRNHILEYALKLESINVEDNKRQPKDKKLLGKTDEETELLKGISESIYSSLSGIPDRDERGYIREALTCLDSRIKAYRAAVLMGWSGTVYHLRKKVEDKGFDEFCQIYQDLSLGKLKRVTIP